MIAGDTELGVRLVSILLALPMSFAVYRSAAILFGGVRVAATATILLNVTLMAAVGTMIVTPDAPLAGGLQLRAVCSGQGAGDRARAHGGLRSAPPSARRCCRNTPRLFFGPAILIWLVSVPKMRRWLLSPWPYLGGLVGARDLLRR